MSVGRGSSAIHHINLMSTAPSMNTMLESVYLREHDMTNCDVKILLAYTKLNAKTQAQVPRLFISTETCSMTRMFVNSCDMSLQWRHMATMASQINSVTVVYAIVRTDADQRKYQSSASLAFVRGIHRWPVNSPHKVPVTRKKFPFDDVIMSMIGVMDYVARRARNLPVPDLQWVAMTWL